jgi:hypothetical protein
MRLTPGLLRGPPAPWNANQLQLRQSLLNSGFLLEPADLWLLIRKVFSNELHKIAYDQVKG